MPKRQMGWRQAIRYGAWLAWFWGLIGTVWADHRIPRHWELTGSQPYGLALGQQGQLYVSQFGSDSVARIAPNGEVQTLGRTGKQPMGLVVDENEQVYVVNYGSHSVTRISPSGEAVELARTGRAPSGIAYSASQRALFVTDSQADTVTRITQDGQASVLGQTGQRPAGIAVDAAGNVYTANYRSHNVTKISPDGQSRVLARTGRNPFGIALDARGNVYTANHGDNTVTKISPTGQVSTLGPTGLHPWGIVVAEDGSIYTSDYDGQTVTRIAPDGRSSIWGSVGSMPMGLARDARGHIYTANHGSRSVTRIDTARVPSPPSDLRVQRLADDQWQLRWQAPQSEGSHPLQDYVLEYRTASQAPWQIWEDGESLDTQSVIGGQCLCSPAEWRVSARNWVGVSEPSSPAGLIEPASPARAALAPQTSAVGTVRAAIAPQAVTPPAVVAVAQAAARPPLGATCPDGLTQVIQQGMFNQPEDVNRLIAFLNAEQGENLKLDGTYDEDDIQAVKRFQLRYSEDILAPWGISQPNGRVSKLTLQKINALRCARR